jgi:ribonuclease D
MAQIESSNTPDVEDYIYVREHEVLETLVQRIRAADRVAIDTEADSLHNYFEKVCLIQLSFSGEHFIVDPLAKLDLREFFEALADKPLVLHGADYDLRMLRSSAGFRPRQDVFDTMIAAQMLGVEQIGLAALVERFFGFLIEKEGQKSDWSRRPLSEKQLRYAVNDTRFLAPLADRLHEELNERGRLRWHAESCRAMVESTGRESMRDPQEAWRIKGSGRLSRRQLAYLRELWRWRDQHARRMNVPPFKVFGNEQIMEVVQWAESHPGLALSHGPKLPRNIAGRLRSTLEEALDRASALSPAQWPGPPRYEHKQALDAERRKELDALRSECTRMAKELAVAPSTVAPRAALEAIVRGRARTVDEIMACSGLLRWQAELIRSAVEKCVR